MSAPRCFGCQRPADPRWRGFHRVGGVLRPFCLDCMEHWDNGPDPETDDHDAACDRYRDTREEDALEV